MDAVIHGVSVWGPGLDGWTTSELVLGGARDYVGSEVSPPPSSLLSATERRRTGAAARLALIVAQQASEMAGIVPGGIPSLFATSNGDGAVVHAILETLAADQPVSPTQFHNSVHNAAAGYWSITTGSQQASTCLTCHDATAATALLMALAEIETERRPLLLCVYDAPLPAPLSACRPTCGLFGAGFVLSPESGQKSVARLSLRYQGTPPPPGADTPRLPALRQLARSNPAARLLRLLEAVATRTEDAFSMALLDGRVDLRVRPC
jgi:hypothetical protein